MLNKKDIIWNSLGVGSSVFISLFFLIIIARLNTLSDVGIFSFAFTFANILFIIGSYGGRTFQVTDTNRDFEESDYIGFRLVTSLIMIVIAILYFAFSRYDFYKSFILILLVILKCIESISDVYYGVLQKKGFLYISGQSLFLKSLFGIIAFFTVDFLTGNLILAILALLLVNILIFLFFDIYFVKKTNVNRISFILVNSKKMLLLCFSFFAFTFLSSIIINFPRLAIDIFLKEEMQAIYSILIMPATSIALFGQFIIQPNIVAIANEYNKRNKSGFIKRLNITVLLLLVFSIFSIVAAYFLGIPILNFVYNLDLSEYKWFLLYVLFGAMFNAIAGVFSVGLTTMRITFEQLLAYIINTVFAVAISLIAVSKYGLAGGIYAFSSIMIVQFFTIFILFIIKIRDINYFKSE